MVGRMTGIELISKALRNIETVIAEKDIQKAEPFRLKAGPGGGTPSWGIAGSIKSWSGVDILGESE